MNGEPKPLIHKLAWIFFFAIWMAYLESAVVVYLRKLYYPDGFSFPIKFIPIQMALIELGREAGTIFMLIAIAFIAGQRGWTRLAYFMYSFGVWDIFYYIWLKIFLNWPESLLTWDLLFLIPVPWVSPVLAPILVSLSLIFGAGIVLFLANKGIRFNLIKKEWIIIVFALVIIFISFVLDAPNILKGGVPTFYHWEMLIIGEIIGIFVLVKAVKRLNSLE